MSRKIILGMFMPFSGFRIDSGATNLSQDVGTYTHSINAVRKLGEDKLAKCERVKFSDMIKCNKK